MRDRVVDIVLRRAGEAAAGDAKRLLQPLLDYDARHGGDLIKTLRVYLETGCNASRAAEKLYLHRSGMLYRLARIEGLLGLSLTDFESRLAIEISVHGMCERHTRR